MSAHVYRRYLLVVLLLVLAFNYVDRLALGLFLQDIKTELSLSDTQLGVLSGIAFAMFYAVMGIPIARWADRGNRITIISLTAAVWSVMVALCGVATNFVQLLLIRVGVAVGEAGCIPPAHSLIADHFSRAERPRAIAIYMLGGPLSMFIGYFLAGWLNEFYGWRATFMMLGLPGLFLAGLVWLTLREPRLRARQATNEEGMTPESVVGVGAHAIRTAPAQPGLWKVFTFLWANPTFRHLLVYFSLFYFFSYGITQWKPAFFMRSFGIQTGELGTWLALIYGLGGLCGTWIGGEWAVRFAANNEGRQLRTMAVAFAAYGILSFFIFVSTTPHVAFGLMALATVGLTASNGPLFGTIQTLVPENMRAVAIAIVYLFANFIGMGLGPLAAGALSDLMRAWAGEESLRYALLALCPGYLWGAWHLWRAGTTVTRDLAAMQAEAQT